MTVAEIGSLVAGISFTVSSIIYIRDTYRARITPSIVTFGVLSLVNLSQLIALISKEVWYVVPFTAIGFTQAAAVTLIALRNKQFYFKLLDKIALGGTLIGFAAWMLSGDAAYNIYIVNAVVVLAFIPLVTKAFRSPTLETKKPWLTNLVASSFLLLTITSVSPYVWVVPVRQFICSLLVNVGIALPSVKKTSKLSD